MNREAIIAALEKLAETHLEAHKVAKTERMIEWHRGMWEAYKDSARIVESEPQEKWEDV